LRSARAIVQRTRRLQLRQSGDGRPVDAFRAAPAQGLSQSWHDHGSGAVKSEIDIRLVGNCHDGKQAATVRHRGLSIVAGRLRRGTVIVVLMSRAVCVGVNLAAVIVRAEWPSVRQCATAGLSENAKATDGARMQSA
jgi:hypothetical protein